MRIRDRGDSFYLVRAAYSSEARRGAETGLGYIPIWATPCDIDEKLKLRKDVALTSDERKQLEEFLARVNPTDSLKMVAAWLQKSIGELAHLPLRERQAKIRAVRPLWNKLSALAGTKNSQAQ